MISWDLRIYYYLVSGARLIVGTTAGPFDAALNEAEVLTVVGSGAVALFLTEAESLSVDDTGGLEDLVEAGAGPGGVGSVSEEDALSVEMEARGGKHRRLRYSST